MRRRRQVRLVAGSPRGVEADAARREVGAELGREVAGGAVVGGDAEHRPPGQAGIVLRERGEHVGTDAGGDAGARRGTGRGVGHLGGEAAEDVVLGSEIEQRAEAARLGRGRFAHSSKLAGAPCSELVPVAEALARRLPGHLALALGAGAALDVVPLVEHRLDRATDSGGCIATWPASWSAASSVRAPGATLWTRPQRCASAASISFEVISRYLATERPQSVTRRAGPTGTPSPAPGKRRRRFEPPTRRSQATATSAPPPTTAPWQAAIVGLREADELVVEVGEELHAADGAVAVEVLADVGAGAQAHVVGRGDDEHADLARRRGRRRGGRAAPRASRCSSRCGTRGGRAAAARSRSRRRRSWSAGLSSGLLARRSLRSESLVDQPLGLARGGLDQPRPASLPSLKRPSTQAETISGSVESGRPTPILTRQKSRLPSPRSRLFRPLWPATPPPSLVRTSPKGRSISSWRAMTRSSGTPSDAAGGAGGVPRLVHEGLRQQDRDAGAAGADPPIGDQAAEALGRGEAPSAS